MHTHTKTKYARPTARQLADFLITLGRSHGGTRPWDNRSSAREYLCARFGVDEQTAARALSIAKQRKTRAHN